MNDQGTAGQRDYAARMLQIEKQREDYYRKLGTPPGVPTMKGATADPDNTGYGYNTIIGELGDHSVPEGWIQRPKCNAVPGTPPGPPVQWDKAEDPDDVQPGYGYVPADTAREDIFFYHTDHLGSTSYITDAKANVAQFDAYLPYGELLVDEHSSTEEMPYKFNGKEFDEETGLYYYGARYMNPRTSLWYGVDPLAEKYPNFNSYCYTYSNPIRYIDPDGKDSYYTDTGKYLFKNNNKTDNIYIVSDYKVIKALKNGVKIVSLKNKKTLEASDLSAKAYSEIFTKELERKGFDTKKLYNGKISVNKLYEQYDPDSRKIDTYAEQYNVAGDFLSYDLTKERGVAVAATRRINGRIEVCVNVYPVGYEENNYVSTESNIKNLLGIHEFQEHGLHKIGKNQHWKILQKQRQDPSWRMTSPQFKSLYKNLERNNNEYKKP